MIQQLFKMNENTLPVPSKGSLLEDGGFYLVKSLEAQSDQQMYHKVQITDTVGDSTYQCNIFRTAEDPNPVQYTLIPFKKPKYRRTINPNRKSVIAKIETNTDTTFGKSEIGVAFDILDKLNGQTTAHPGTTTIVTDATVVSPMAQKPYWQQREMHPLIKKSK